MKLFIVGSLCVALVASTTPEAFAWGAVGGPYGGAAYRGPAGGAAVRGPYGGAAVRGPYGGTAYRPPGGGYYGGDYPEAGVAAGAAVGVAVGAAASYRPPPYCAPPGVVAAPACGYYPYPPC